MEFLPKTLGTRPRLACEVRAEGVVAARAENAQAVLSAVSKVQLPDGIAVPQVRVGDSAAAAASGLGDGRSRQALVSGVRTALEQVGSRGRDVTLVVPDAAVRVLLLDFDALPQKPAEALPIVRFRLKKLLPFDAEHAAVSYQVMSTRRDGLQVLAVAMPHDLLDEYEGIVREAGFEPGAVLPSTLATISGLTDGELPILLVNAGRDAVTTAIVRSGVVLLHRTVDLAEARAELVSAPEDKRGDTAADTSFSAIAARLSAAINPQTRGPEAPAPVAPTSAPAEAARADAPTNEVAQAVSVAVAYFEDTLETAPSLVLSAGTLGATALTALLDDRQVRPMAVQEVVARQMLGPGAQSAGSPGGIPLGWLAGVRGALAN